MDRLEDASRPAQRPKEDEGGKWPSWQAGLAKRKGEIGRPRKEKGEGENRKTGWNWSMKI